MTEFYVAATQFVMLPKSGRKFQMRKGLHHLPEELADHATANGLGIKPPEEMTDAEWRALGLNKDTWFADRAAKLEAAKPKVEEPVAPVVQQSDDVVTEAEPVRLADDHEPAPAEEGHPAIPQPMDYTRTF